MKVAVITMAYNEKNNLVAWLKHYAKELGAENLFILDHGSDDNSTADLQPVNVIRIPRSPLDNDKRTDAVSHLTNSLLSWYDYVIYVDADELIVADPGKYDGILNYLEIVRPAYINSIGINVIHDLTKDTDLDYGRPITSQRTLGMFAAPMSKPNITSIPVSWSTGFHYRELPSIFGDVFLFHLRYSDMKSGLNRLNLTRDLDRARPGSSQHQRVSDDAWLSRIRGWHKLPLVIDDPWSSTDGILAGHIKAFRDDEVRVQGAKTYRSAGGSYLGSELLKIPERFLGSF